MSKEDLVKHQYTARPMTSDREAAEKELYEAVHAMREAKERYHQALTTAKEAGSTDRAMCLIVGCTEAAVRMYMHRNNLRPDGKTLPQR